MTGRNAAYRDEAAERRAALGATLILSAVLLAPLWPLVLVALATMAAAWACGMHPARPARAAAWSAPVAAAYAVSAAIQDRTWKAWASQPVTDWHHADILLIHRHVLPAVLLTAPLAIPAGVGVLLDVQR